MEICVSYLPHSVFMKIQTHNICENALEMPNCQVFLFPLNLSLGDKKQGAEGPQYTSSLQGTAINK